MIVSDIVWIILSTIFICALVFPLVWIYIKFIEVVIDDLKNTKKE